MNNFIVAIITSVCIIISVNLMAQNDGINKTIDYKAQPEEYYRTSLSKETYYICREQGTEQAFSGQYDKFYEAGVYYCACCGGDFPLYRSDAKYDSKTGWPSFWQAYDNKSIELKPDNRLISRFFGATTEVVCARCGSHLGHVFDDGPQDKTGKRHCINSLALRFVPEGQRP